MVHSILVGPKTIVPDRRILAMFKPAATGQLSPALRLLAQVGNRLARVFAIHPLSVPNSGGRDSEVIQLGIDASGA
ncbi:MAG: hypothetical protein IPO43_21115 [Rhodoferax sp.]|nr:hypothetical protein [Rhodoferax sp.]